MRFGIVQFPGSNCDRDCHHVLQNVLHTQVDYLWHDLSALPHSYDVLVLPGGFAHGDYLRTGAMAKFARIMPAILEHVEQGRFLLGICNGFQILTELKLLPGALLRNRNLSFINRTVGLKVERNDSFATKNYAKGQVIRLPINHGEGCYYCDGETLKSIEDKNQVLLRYCSPLGEVNDAANPNGALHSIAGLINTRGNVIGLMPHPERVCEPDLGNTDGLPFFQSLAGITPGIAS